jgi:hypothetical protein
MTPWILCGALTSLVQWPDNDAALPPRLTLITSPKIDRAISAGVSVAMSSPMGA